jgi:hypothetical protein
MEIDGIVCRTLDLGRVFQDDQTMFWRIVDDLANDGVGQRRLA